MWLLDSTRIFVQDLEGNTEQIISRLNPLSGGTVLQLFGYDDEITSLNFKVVGSGDVDTISSMTIDGATHTLSGPSYYDTFYVAKFSYKSTMSACQTLRQDLDSTAIVYDGQVELYGA